MAVTLEYNLVCKNLIWNDIKVVLDTFKIKEKSIYCIDDWRWHSKKKILNTDIEKMLVEYKIIVLELESLNFKSIGLYIEKRQSKYFYTFWIDTEGYPELAFDAINSGNVALYDMSYQILDKMIEKGDIKFELLTIGCEAVFDYSEDFNEMFGNSSNIVTWIINSKMKSNIQTSLLSLGNYHERSCSNLKFTIYEKLG